jgi:uncharacterized membrane protein
MKIATTVVVALALTGCSVVFPKAGPQLANAVNKYCVTLSEEERRLLREQVNASIQPNQACVYCDGDMSNSCKAP